MFPTIWTIRVVPATDQNHKNAYKTLRSLTFGGPSGGAENAESHPDAYKTLRFFNIFDFLGVTEMGPRDRSLGQARAARGGIT